MASTPRPVVLIVEDERDLADLYAEWLRETADVHIAYTATEAIAHLDDSIDVVLLDRRMPDQSGDAVLDEIRDCDLSCRVAMVTAVDPDYDIIEMGFDDYLVKPVTRTELRETTARLYRRQQYSNEVMELAATAAKMAVLETQKSSDDLDGSREYAELVTRFEDLQARADASVDDLDHADFEALFRDLDIEDDRSRDG